VTQPDDFSLGLGQLARAVTKFKLGHHVAGKDFSARAFDRAVSLRATLSMTHSVPNAWPDGEINGAPAVETDLGAGGDERVVFEALVLGGIGDDEQVLLQNRVGRKGRRRGWFH